MTAPTLPPEARAWLERYPAGFTTAIATQAFPPGLNEAVVRALAEIKHEPDWLLEWRLAALRHWMTLTPPSWGQLRLPALDFQALSYHAAPDTPLTSLDELDPALLATYEKLGVPLHERARLAGVAVDAVFDSVSLGTTHQAELARAGVLFCSMSEAVQRYPELVQRYLGSVVGPGDNFYAALNAAVFSDGSFVYVPPGVKCPMELSTYFRINAGHTGQFERTLIVADKNSEVSYMEGCFLAGTPINTLDGVKRIEDVQAKDWLWTHTGHASQVTHTMERPYSGPIYRIKPVGLDEPLQTTPEHPFLAIKRQAVVNRKARNEHWQPGVNTRKLFNETPSWVCAKDLEPGDFLVFPKIQPTPSDGSFTNEEVELLGYYLAEGSARYNTANKQYTIQLSLGLHEENLAHRIRELVSAVFSRPSYLTRQPDRNGLMVTFYSKIAMNWFHEHVGIGAKNKRLSRALAELPLHQIEIFIQAYLQGDGNISSRHHKRKDGQTTARPFLRLCTSSRILSLDIQQLLRRAGIFSVSVKRKGGQDQGPKGRVLTRSDSWMICWVVGGRFNQVRQTEAYFLVPIRSITQHKGETKVYNFSVRDQESYLVNGAAVHNCTAPMRSSQQLHAAVVEIVALQESQVRYATVQNWYPGDSKGRGGILNFVTKRADCREAGARVQWTQVEVGSAITWKYPSCVLQGRGSVGAFHSVALTHHHQQADTGTKMIHVGADTRSTILAKGISAGQSANTYRGLVKVAPSARGARNHSRCDSLLIGSACAAHTLPTFESRQPQAILEHEATTTRLSEDQLFYCRSRGLPEGEAAALMVNGFCREVFQALPMEFALEARKLMEVSLEGAVG